MALARVLCPILIGRDSELSALEDALLAALRGDGGVVILGGEAGWGRPGSLASSRPGRSVCAASSCQEHAARPGSRA